MDSAGLLCRFAGKTALMMATQAGMMNLLISRCSRVAFCSVCLSFQMPSSI